MLDASPLAHVSPEPIAIPHDSGLPRLLRWHRFLLILLALLAPFSIWTVVKDSANDLAADHRLAPTFAVVRGYDLYYPADSGPVLSTLYGPITALTYLPATIGHTPRTAILIGTFIALMLFFGSMLLAVREAVDGRWTKTWELTGLIIGLVWLVDPIQRAASHVHADAPALGFAALATFFALRERHKYASYENALMAGFFTSLSIFSKQNMVPLVVGFAAWFAITRGWKTLLMFTASVTGISVAIVAITIRWFGTASAFFFNCVYMPLHQPYDKAQFFPALNVMLVTSLALLLIPVVRTLQMGAQHGWSVERLFRRKTSLLIVMGILLVPTSIMGRMKAGGNVSALSPALFFFAMALLAEIASGRDFAKRAELKLWSFPVVAACILGLSSAVYFSVKPAPTENAPTAAFEYARRHPGQVYFPQFPLVHLMTEGKLYDFSWGLTDRRLAGKPVSEISFAANVPPEATVVAITEFVPQYEEEMANRLGEPIANFSDSSQLPQFKFFKLNRPAK